MGEDTAVPDVEAASYVVDATTSIADATMALDISLANPAIPSLAPEEAVQPSMGSSRITGGIFCGHAQGNVLNHADISAMSMSLDFNTPVKGEVFLYLTDQYPRHINFDLLKGESELVVIVKVVGSMAPILNMVARKFSVIQSKCLLL